MFYSLGIAAFLMTVSLICLPGIDGVRDNAIMMIPITALLACAVIASGKSKALSLLMAYAAIHIYCVTTTYGALASAFQIAMYAVIYAVLVMSWEKWQNRKNIVYNAICIIALLNMVLMIFQHFGVYLIHRIPEGTIYDRVFGFTANPNEASALFAIALPFFFRKRWLWCIPAVILGFYLARTTNGVLAAAIVCIVAIFAYYRSIKSLHPILQIDKVLLCLAVIFLLFNIAVIDRFDYKDQMAGRGIIYKRTAELASVHPTGWGLNQYRFIVPLMTYGKHMSDIQKTAAFVQLSRKDLIDKSLETITGIKDKPEEMKKYLDAHAVSAAFVQAHNEYLEWTFISGYAGLAFLLFAIIATIRKGFSMQDKLPVLSFTASCLTALFFFTWQIVPLAVLTIVSMAMIHGYKSPIIIWEEKG